MGLTTPGSCQLPSGWANWSDPRLHQKTSKELSVPLLHQVWLWCSRGVVRPCLQNGLRAHITPMVPGWLKVHCWHAASTWMPMQSGICPMDGGTWLHTVPEVGNPDCWKLCLLDETVHSRMSVWSQPLIHWSLINLFLIKLKMTASLPYFCPFSFTTP